MLPHPPKHCLPEGPGYGLLLALLDDVLVPASALAAHWGYTENHLANMRRDGVQRGLPFVKLPTGGVRYRMSEILAAEIGGTTGPLTIDRVLLAVSACKGVSPEVRAAVIEHLKATLMAKR